MAKIRLSLLQHTHQIPPHILVDFFRIRFSDSVGYAVAGEGAAAFFVAAEGADLTPTVGA